MSETRQRWRIVFSRDEDARFLSHLDAVKLWERAFRRGSIPIAQTEGLHPRPRLIFAAPLPLGVLAERELADLYLSERLSLPELRDRLGRDLPAGYSLIELHDVWLGAPALAPQLVAADYRVAVLGASPGQLACAAESLMAADRLDREKRREAKAVAYDLRPLLIDLRVGAGRSSAPGPTPPESAEVWMRLRHSQDLGSGRHDEVVAALEEELRAGADPEWRQRDLEIVHPVRERLWLAEELET